MNPKTETNTTSLAVIGVDIGKDVFHLVGFGVDGKIAFRRKEGRKIRRLGLRDVFEKLSAHFVSRVLRGLGHEPRIIPAIYVKPFVKGQKNDYNDAEAIAEAALRPNLRFVQEKSQDQLDLQACHRVRSRLVSRRTATINQIRAFLIEQGIAVRAGPRALRNSLFAIYHRSRRGRTDGKPAAAKSIYTGAAVNCLAEGDLAMSRLTRRTILVAAPAALAFAGPLSIGRPARAADRYGPGVTDKAIKIGNTSPYSGPASSYGTIGKSQAAYYRMINEQGGVNGREIDFISYDDGYLPPKTVEMTRKLVEEDEVLAIASPLGTPTNSATWHYMNQKKVPQLFIASGATKWDDPEHHPWTIGWQPNYQSEGRIYATYILSAKPDGKIGVLYQNDDAGKDYLKGLTDGLTAKGKASMIKDAAAYEPTDPTIDSQIVGMKAAGCDVLVTASIPKMAAQAIRKAAEIEWKPLHVLSSVANSVGATRYFQGHRIRLLLEGPDRPAVEGRSWL